MRKKLKLESAQPEGLGREENTSLGGLLIGSGYLGEEGGAASEGSTEAVLYRWITELSQDLRV